MFRFRRVWLFPLLALTLFFVACGWRNWHLERDERGAWLECTAWTMNQLPRQTVWNGDLNIENQDESVILRVMKRNYPDATARFAGDEPNLEIGSLPNINVGSPQIRSRFYATTQVVINLPSGNWSATDIELTRSPLKFWDNTWHVVRARKHSVR